MPDPQQMVLPLPRKRAGGRSDFFVSDANRVAMTRIEAWRDWPGGRLMLTGLNGAGKSHLAAVWAELAGADMISAKAVGPQDGPLVVEDAHLIAGDGAGEEALFHLYNRLDRRHPLLITATRSPARWGTALPDLTSRLMSMDRAHIDPPDDALLSAVLMKHFDDRQLNVTADVISQIGKRMVRSLEQTEEIVNKLDRAALLAKRRITWPFARKVLPELIGEMDGSGHDE